MKPYYHAQKSVKKYGGTVKDYQKIHDWFDQTKAHVADMRHRAVLHNAWGIFLCEQVFGITMVNSDGRTVNIRDIGEQHVIEDLGRIPSLFECVKDLPMQTWYGGPSKKTRKMKLSELVD